MQTTKEDLREAFTKAFTWDIQHELEKSMHQILDDRGYTFTDKQVEEYVSKRLSAVWAEEG